MDRSYCCGRMGIVCGFLFAAASGVVFASTPITSVSVRANTGGTGGVYSDGSSITTPNGTSSDSASVGANTSGSDGSHADASADAFADFGTLGVQGSGNGLTPPAKPTSGVDATSQAIAFWDDFLTPVAIVGSALQPGSLVTTNLLLDLDFSDTLASFGNSAGFSNYELIASLGSSIVLDDCFVTDVNINFCGPGSHLVGIPGNTAGPTTIQLAPIPLSLAIMQPFELGVSLVFDGECNVGPDQTQTSTCSFTGDALHTSTALLQPLGDFVLVADSGHDYSVRATNVPEPGSLALVLAALSAVTLGAGRVSSGGNALASSGAAKVRQSTNSWTPAGGPSL